MKPKVVKLQKYPIVERTLHESGIMLLASKFLKYQELVIQQRKNGKLLSDLLMGKHFVIIPLQGSNPNYFLVPLRCKNRDSVIRHLISKGIEAGRHFSDSIHWVKGFGYIEGSCPVFEQITKDILTVPCHYFLDSRKIEYIAKTLNQYNDK